MLQFPCSFQGFSGRYCYVFPVIELCRPSQRVHQSCGLFSSCLGLPIDKPRCQDIQDRIEIESCVASFPLWLGPTGHPPSPSVDYRIPAPPSVRQDSSPHCQDRCSTPPSESPHLHQASSSAQPHFPATLAYYTDLESLPRWHSRSWAFPIPEDNKTNDSKNPPPTPNARLSTVRQTSGYMSSSQRCSRRLMRCWTMSLSPNLRKWL